MSHWKKFESNVLENTKRNLLTAALAEMGLTLDFTQNQIRNTWGSERVDASLFKNGKQLALGINFKMNDGVEQLELSGDFFGTGLNEATFIDKLAQIYQKHNVIEKCEEQGWNIDSITENENGEYVVLASQWA